MTGMAWVISTKPRSPMGVGARLPPMILGAINAMTLCTTLSETAGAASAPPHSQSRDRNPRCLQYLETTSGVRKSNSTTCTPLPVRNSCMGRLAPRCVATMVVDTEVSHIAASRGRSNVLDITIRVGCHPSSRRVVSWGLSRRTVWPPTMTAFTEARVAKTICLESLLLTHALCPEVAAILPSIVIAYLRMPIGRSLAARWIRPSFASCTARRTGKPTLPSATSTSIPASFSAAIAFPRKWGSGCGIPMTHRTTPLSINARTAASSPSQSPHSKLRKAVPPVALPPASLTA
mmetsp:Transcript_8003/g.21729  ORF Transcript_8003/g.21729 Transcript_8003/m.21729 type:complete len:291 (-) Transcript_8003:398-1270(-)